MFSADDIFIRLISRVDLEITNAGSKNKLRGVRLPKDWKKFQIPICIIFSTLKYVRFIHTRITDSFLIKGIRPKMKAHAQRHCGFRISKEKIATRRKFRSNFFLNCGIRCSLVREYVKYHVANFFFTRNRMLKKI